VCREKLLPSNNKTAASDYRHSKKNITFPHKTNLKSIWAAKVAATPIRSRRAGLG
jgi:hypothetical protein